MGDNSRPRSNLWMSDVGNGKRVLMPYLVPHKYHCCEVPGREQICSQQGATKELVIAERNG